MENETMQHLISEKGFDKFATELATRCDKEGIDFAYQYNAGVNGLTVWMNFGNIPATVEISIDGDVTFIYFEGGGRRSEKFKKFTPEDFNTLLDHAFLFLRDGDLNHHKDWCTNLKKV
jgi:hypothetical protein